MTLWTALLLGLVGSLHCAGMCGPLALALPPGSNSRFGFVAGRLAYNFGRIVTYCSLGLIFGVIGRSLFLAGIQRWVSIFLGLILLVGLCSSRRLSVWRPVSGVVEALKRRMSGVLRRRSLSSLAALGLL